MTLDLPNTEMIKTFIIFRFLEYLIVFKNIMKKYKDLRKCKIYHKKCRTRHFWHLKKKFQKAC